MSENWVEPGWWYASDGKWYPPLDVDGSTPHSDSDLRDVGGVADLNESGEDAGVPSDGPPTESAQSGPAGPELDLTKLDAEAVRVEALSEGHEDVAHDQESLDLPAVTFSVARPSAAGDDRLPTDLARTDRDRPASMTRSVVGPSVRSGGGSSSDAAPSNASSNSGGGGGKGSLSSASMASPLRPGTDATESAAKAGPMQGSDSDAAESTARKPATRSEARGKEFWDEQSTQGSQRRQSFLFVVAVALAVLSGILGALWLRERNVAEELRENIAAVQVDDQSSELSALEGQNDTLRLQNEQLEQQLADMSALVLELPEGRVTEVDVPFTPVFADEEGGRLIAVGATGEYVVWGDGVINPITDSGSVDGSPTGLFAGGGRAWISTENPQIDVIPMSLELGPQDPVPYGPARFLVPDTRVFWTFDPAIGEIVRIRRADNTITQSVPIPVEVVDLTIGAGSVWALGDDGRVYRINTADFTVQPIDAGEDLISIAASPDALWTLSAADGSLRRIDPVTGAVLVTVPVGRDPIDAMFAGSSVWVGLRAGSSLIEVDTRTSAVVSRTALDSEPAALHQGDSGVFVTTVAEEAQMLFIDSLVTGEANEDAADAEAGTDGTDGTDGAAGDTDAATN